jgi:hypothetical protein
LGIFPNRHSFGKWFRSGGILDHTYLAPIEFGGEKLRQIIFLRVVLGYRNNQTAAGVESHKYDESSNTASDPDLSDFRPKPKTLTFARLSSSIIAGDDDHFVRLAPVHRSGDRKEVAAAISPWNFAALLPARKIAAESMTG